MHQQSATQSVWLPTPWVGYAVLSLDRWLRRRQGVYEYSGHPACLFRVQRAQAEECVCLSDGTRITAGDPVLSLHLWNEHVPAIGPSGATVAWARQFSRAAKFSLRELALHLAQSKELADIRAIRGDMRLGTAAQNDCLVRLSRHFGFEEADGTNGAPGAMQRLGENFFILLLVLAANPNAVGGAVLRRNRKLVYLSRQALERRYRTSRRRYLPPGGREQ